MSFDSSRFTFYPWNDYLGVVMQQGRVQLDADWNEWLAQFARRIQAGSMDTMGRAMVPSKIETAAMLHTLLGSPLPPAGSLGGPAYTLSAPGTAFALRVGAPVCDEAGSRLAPVDIVLETDSRNPKAKHAILEMYVAQGLDKFVLWPIAEPAAWAKQVELVGREIAQG